MRFRILAAATAAAAALTAAVAAAPIASVAHADAPRAGGDYVPVPGGGTLFDQSVNAGTNTPIQALGTGGIPTSNVSAILVDITAINPTATTYLNLYPSGGAAGTSDLNAVAKSPGVSNSTVVPVGSDGRVVLFNSAGSLRVNIEVQGYYTASDAGSGPGGLIPVTQQRVVDTRLGTGAPKAKIAAGASLTVTMAGGPSPAPLGSKAVYVDVIGIATATGYLTASPTAGPATSKGLLNFAAGTHSSGGSVVPDANGKVTFVNHSSGTLDLVVTVQSYSSPDIATGSGYRPATQRILSSALVKTKGTIDLVVTGRPGVPTNNVTAVALGLAATGTAQGGQLAIWPKGAAQPVASTTNYNTSTVASSMWVAPGVDGKVTIYNAGPVDTHVYVDLNGFYTSTKPTAAPPRFSPTVAQEYTTSGSTLKGLEYSYVDNTGRLLVGTQADEGTFSDVQYTTISSLADTFAGTPDLTITGSTAQVTAEYSDTGVRSKSAAAGTAPSASAAFTNFGGSFAGSPDLAVLPNGTSSLFAIDTDGALWTYPQGGAEPWWHKLGNANLAGTPTVTPSTNGVRITAATKAGSVATTTYVNNVLAAWTDLGGAGIVTRPAVATRPGNLAQIVVTQGDGLVATKAEQADGTWGPGIDLGGGDSDPFRSTGAPAVIFDSVSGQIEALARSSSDGLIYSSGETTQGSQEFRTWTPVSGSAAASDPTMTALTGSTGGWVGVYRTPQNATRVIQPTYDGSAAARTKTFTGTTTKELPAAKN